LGGVVTYLLFAKLKFLFVRLAVLAGGLFLFAANMMGESDGNTVLGLYPPNSGERIGYDLAKLAIGGLALWIMYRGVRGSWRAEDYARDHESAPPPIVATDSPPTTRSRRSTGLRRLAVFGSVVWVGFWFLAFLVDGPPFSWGGFVLFGVAPVAVLVGVPLGIAWVISGFKADRGERSVSPS
jgi:hypothetical protein